MLTLLKSLMRAPERKTSRTGRIVALEGGGRPRWTPRDYAALTREGYARNAIVYRAVRLIAESIGGLSFILYEDEKELTQHPLIDLMSRPNPRQNGAAFLESVASHLLLAGNAYIEAVSLPDTGDESASVRELYVLRPDRMQIVPGQDGWPQAYEYTVGGATVRFDQSAPLPPILQLTLFHPLDDYYGFSPLEAAAIAIDTHNAAAKWNKALLDNAARPSGALVYAAPRRGSLWPTCSSSGSSANSRGNIRARPMPGGRWCSRAASTGRRCRCRRKDMDFMEAKHAAAREIALAFGVPPMLLGHPRRQYLLELSGGQPGAVAAMRAAAGRAHRAGADAVAVAGLRRAADAGRRYRSDRGLVGRPRRLVGARDQSAVPDDERKARRRRLWRAAGRGHVRLLSNPERAMSDLIAIFNARGDLAHVALLLWAMSASALTWFALRELAAASRRFDDFVRELARFNEHFGGK